MIIGNGTYLGDAVWYAMIFGPIIILIWLVVLVVLAAAVTRWLQGGGAVSFPFAPSKKRAVEILEERFAKGEIDKDEFQEKRRLLTDSTSR
jgi:putative membrane protein